MMARKQSRSPAKKSKVAKPTPTRSHGNDGQSNREGLRPSVPAGLKTAFLQIHRPTTVKEEVYRTLRDQLTSGHAAPNERIIESEVTNQLGVSRTPVREALARLASEGFLVGTRYGYRVPEFSPEDVLNLSEIRLLLEPIAAGQAAERIPEGELQNLQRIISEEKSAHAATDINAFLHAHHRFRMTWLGFASNPLLIEALARTLHSLSLIRLRTMNDVELRDFIIDSHERLFAALASRNPERAARVQTETIRKFTDLIRARIFNQPDHSQAVKRGAGAGAPDSLFPES